MVGQHSHTQYPVMMTSHLSQSISNLTTGMAAGGTSLRTSCGHSKCSAYLNVCSCQAVQCKWRVARDVASAAMPSCQHGSSSEHSTLLCYQDIPGHAAHLGQGAAVECQNPYELALLP